MKSFKDLIEEVQKKGLCHHCGACVNFCTAINYGALQMDPEGKPELVDEDQCVECGLCYTICPETEEIDEEMKRHFQCDPPYGPVMSIVMARSTDHEILDKATDGGVITTLLISMLENGDIDGAIVSRQTGPMNREPWLATTKQEIFEAAGFTLSMTQGMQVFSNIYSTYSPSVEKFRPVLQRGLRRVALVAPPCQIKAVRKMQYQSLVPSNSITYTFGLVCSGSFTLGEKEKMHLEQLIGCSWEEVKKINLKEELIFTLYNGKTVSLPLDQLHFIKRYACNFCYDYTAECADISFGGVGADPGWTTVITRTPIAHSLFYQRGKNCMEIIDSESRPEAISNIEKKISFLSENKRLKAYENRQKLLLNSQTV